MTAGKRFKRLVRQRARRTGESYVSARRALLPTPTEEAMQDNDLVELELLAVKAEVGQQQWSYLEFREAGGSRHLRIGIGAAEGSSIAFALTQRSAPRPMTHDALKQMIDALGGRIGRVVLGFVPEANTYTADVTVVLADGRERHFDWRPSDAVALALRTDPRPAILAPNAVLDTPPPKGEAVYSLRCSCGTVVRFRESELTPVPERPGSFTTDGTCPSCGKPVQRLIAPPPSD